MTATAGHIYSDLFVWGSCEDGQLGLEDTDTGQVLLPKPLHSSQIPEFTQISCGYKHTVLLTADGEVYSCGCNEFQQLGHKMPGNTLNKIDAFDQHRIISVACGAYHNAAITYNGLLFTWGCNLNGQLGREGEDTGVKLVMALSGHRVVQASLGVEHSLVLTDTSRLFVFGANSKGQLGLGFASENFVTIPQQVVCLSSLPIRRIVAGGFHSFVLTISGTVYGWGANNRGQLGLGYCGSSADISDATDAYTSTVSSSLQESIDQSNTEEAPPKRRPSSPFGISQSCVAVPTIIKSLKMHSVVHVSCGEAHTVVLTRDGGVFTFGSGRYGQLGHGQSTIGSPVPRKVVEFMGSEVTQIACGRMHSLALIPSSGRLYAFGAGTDGQLGVGDVNNHLIPSPVKGPWVAATGVPNRTGCDNDLPSVEPHVIKRIFTGGNHVYMLTKKFVLGEITSVDDLRNWNRSSLQSIITLCPEVVEQLRKAVTALPLPAPVSRSASLSSSRLILTSSATYDEPMTTVQQLHAVFSSLACLSASCLQDGELQTHYNTGREEHGVDLDSAHVLQSQVFQLLATKDLRCLINKLMSNVLDVSRSNYPSIECLRGFMVLAVSDLLNMPHEIPDSSTIAAKPDVESEPYPILNAGFSNPGLVLNAFAVAVNKLDPAPSKILDRWLVKIQPRYLKRLVLNLNNMIVFTLDVRPASKGEFKLQEEYFRNILELMKRLYKVNENHPSPISYSSFYIPSLKDKINIDSVFVNWVRACESGTTSFFSFMDYPFVFDAACKAQMLSVEARLTMHQINLNAVRSFLPLYTDLAVTIPCFSIIVRRDNLLQDTINNLTMANPNDLKKVLRVKFENEEAIDEGGVMKEFFLLVMRDLLNPAYGMFKCYPESRMLWFNESNMEGESIFSMVGILCGLAIYNSIIVDLSFPLAMFKKLLGESPSLDDLKELNPTVGRSLQKLLDYEESDVVDVFCLTFSTTVDFYGEKRVIPLIENGENVDVTKENKAEYVDKYVDYLFNKSCEIPYKAFEKGFHQVCGGYSLKLFHPTELQSLVVGSEAVNWYELREHTKYIGVYWDRHPVIQWFWEVLLMEFTIEEKKKFLRFLTGCDRVPFLGFSGIKITIQPNNSGDNYLPVAHTCANLLDLPLYSSKEVLSRKLSLAIQQTEGFGLI